MAATAGSRTHLLAQLSNQLLWGSTQPRQLLLSSLSLSIITCAFHRCCFLAVGVQAKVNQSLHFVVFLFFGALAADEAPAAPGPLGELPY